MSLPHVAQKGILAQKKIKLQRKLHLEKSAQPLLKSIFEIHLTLACFHLE